MTTTQSAVIGAPKKGPCGRSPGPCSHCRYSSARAPNSRCQKLFSMCQRSARTQSAGEPTLRTSEARRNESREMLRAAPAKPSHAVLLGHSTRDLHGGSRARDLFLVLLSASKNRCSKQASKAKCDVWRKKLARDLHFLGVDPVKGP